MIATGVRKSEGAPQARWLIRAGTFTSLAMAGGLIALLWTVFFTVEDASAPAITGLLAGTLAAMAGGFTMRQIILDLAAREKRAARQAGHDLLSGLANRKLFTQWVEYELARHRREGVHFALMYLDIDHFKEINDRHGHDAGDRMIMAFARRISETLRPTDRLARFGGDEFAILQTGVRTMRDAEALANRIVDSMRLSFDLGQLEIASSVSIGIALCPENASERDDLMKLADLALYRAKKEGRNRFAFFDARMGEELARRRAFSVELAGAIASDTLTLDYQPVFSAEGRRVVSAEARLRWAHPQRGLIGAKEISSIAEERGLLLPLGDWVLRRACQDASKWNGVRVAVNIAPVHFQDRDFAAQILRILHETGLDPTRLDLMLTEDCILHPRDHAIAGMTTLRHEGVRFTLARFGAGVASMNYIRRVPINRLKFDRSCTEAAPSMTEAAAILHAMIHLGREIGLTMAAEGLETEEQIRYLTALGCHELQGRILAPHAEAAAIEELAATRLTVAAGAA